MKVWDITQPKDRWDETFAKMQYEIIGLMQVTDWKFGNGRIISIDDDTALIESRQDMLDARDEDEEQQDV